MLYLEVPAGVGFSIGQMESVIKDEDVVEDIMLALRLFYSRFPTYRKNELYLTGHGYAAVYIVKTSRQIIE